MEYNYPPSPVTLTGTHVQLLPMDKKYLSQLQEAVKDGELWRLWYTSVPTPDQMENWISKALEEQQSGVSCPFVVVRKTDNRIVGSTRYMNIEKDIHRLEIGTTWYSKSAQRSPVNSECKLLLLEHAFENLMCLAVEFRTHRLNVQSRRAIERLGAQFDGVLRNHRISANGTVRDTVVYSVIASEWENVKSNVHFMLNEKYSGQQSVHSSR
jgi:RimJ/RimL family protein N-acetyltransferase